MTPSEMEKIKKEMFTFGDFVKLTRPLKEEKGGKRAKTIAKTGDLFMIAGSREKNHGMD